MQTEKPVIQMFDVARQYGARHALKGITLSVNTGELVLITGASGAGKTTLLKLIYLEESAGSGRIIIGGMNLARLSARRVPYLRRRMGVIFQDFRLIPHRSVYRNVSLVLEAAGQPAGVIRKKVMAVLERTGMQDRMNTLPPALSGGEQQKVAVARALVGDPDIILADEPTGSLDPDSARTIIRYLLECRNRGATLVVVSHSRELIREMPFDRLHTLVEGRLVNTVGAVPGNTAPPAAGETGGQTQPQLVNDAGVNDADAETLQDPHHAPGGSS